MNAGIIEWMNHVVTGLCHPPLSLCILSNQSPQDQGLNYERFLWSHTKPHQAFSFRGPSVTPVQKSGLRLDHCFSTPGFLPSILDLLIGFHRSFHAISTNSPWTMEGPDTLGSAFTILQPRLCYLLVTWYTNTWVEGQSWLPKKRSHPIEIHSKIHH